MNPNYDFFSIYSSQKEFAPENKKDFGENSSQVLLNKNAEQINTLPTQNQNLQNEINYLKKIITLIESKKEITNTMVNESVN